MTFPRNNPDMSHVIFHKTFSCFFFNAFQTEPSNPPAWWQRRPRRRCIWMWCDASPYQQSIPLLLCSCLYPNLEDKCHILKTKNKRRSFRTSKESTFIVSRLERQTFVVLYMPGFIVLCLFLPLFKLWNAVESYFLFILCGLQTKITPVMSRFIVLLGFHTNCYNCDLFWLNRPQNLIQSLPSTHDCTKLTVALINGTMFHLSSKGP